MYCASSVGCDYEIPEEKAVVRATSPIAGVILRPDENDPNKTNMTIISEADLKVGVPDFIVRQALKDQGYQIERLRKVLALWKEKYPGENRP
jgi:hypothetical protein